MTVGELIDKLQKYPKSYEVMSWDGYNHEYVHPKVVQTTMSRVNFKRHKNSLPKAAIEAGFGDYVDKIWSDTVEFSAPKYIETRNIIAISMVNRPKIKI